MTRIIGSLVFALVVFGATEPTLGIVNCNGTQFFPGNTTLADDYEQTSGSSPCIEVTGSATINLNGKTITCNQPGGCDGEAILVSADNVTINGGGATIVGDWEDGIQNGFSGSTAYDLTVRNVVVDGAVVGLTFPGDLTEKNVFKNMQADCIGTFLVRVPTGALITQNYCDSNSDGITIIGPSSGAGAVIRQNYVIAGSTGIDLHDGIGELERNVISEASTPIAIGGSATGTLTMNLCDDGTKCEQPDDAPFTFDFNW
jgi:hypothetical protein